LSSLLEIPDRVRDNGHAVHSRDVLSASSDMRVELLPAGDPARAKRGTRCCVLASCNAARQDSTLSLAACAHFVFDTRRCLSTRCHSRTIDLYDDFEVSETGHEALAMPRHRRLAPRSRLGDHHRMHRFVVFYSQEWPASQ
jgi:hypothetical protein